MKNRIIWRCFHCGEAFTAKQKAHAAQHFGRDESATAACLMREPGEHSLLSALRTAEEELARWRSETMPILNAMAAMQAAHAEALRREEERGYAKGLAEARTEHAAVTARRDAALRQMQERVLTRSRAAGLAATSCAQISTTAESLNEMQAELLDRVEDA